jgi:HEAT repeat protein
MLLTSAVMGVCAILPLSTRAQDAIPAATAPAAGVPAADAPAATVPAADAAGGDVATAPASSVSKDSPLAKLASDVLHYSIVGNLEMAHDSGQAILDKKPDPKDILMAFEAAADGRDPKAILERDLKQPLLKDMATAMMEQIEAGYREVSRDPVRIRADIEKLGDSLRSYQNAKEHLTAAGQFAVPYYIQYLQESKHRDLQPYITRVMTEIGRPLLPAMVQQLQTPNDAEKLILIPVMGDIGYPLAVPYLKAVAQDDKVLAEVRSAAENALAKINEKTGLGRGSAADSFQALAVSYFDSRPSVAAAGPTEPTNPIWYYNKGLNNVAGVPVPTVIWNDIQAMRAAEMAIKLDPNKAAAISMWVGANLRRELHLPAGAKDPTRVEGAPDAMFYALAAGPMYLNPVLNKALDDRDSPLVLKALLALERTGGTQGTVFAAVKDLGNPLVRALGYPDRAVRFNAAFALGRSNPAKDFAGSFRVVPILCEAIAQGNSPHIVLVDPDETNRARMRSVLTDLNYVVHAGSSLTAAMSDAASATAFDAAIIPASEALHVAELATTDYRLTAIPVLVLGDPGRQAALGAEIARIGPMYKPAPLDIDAGTLAVQLADMKKNVATTPVDATTVTMFALTSIGVLDNLAIDKQSIFKVIDAVPTLAEAVKDKRLDVAIAAAGVLGKINSANAQKAIAQQIFVDGLDIKLKKALLDALSASAKVAGNHVDPATIDKLIGTVTAEGDPAIRSSAAEALGALNVQSDQSRNLILEQAR